MKRQVRPPLSALIFLLAAVVITACSKSEKSETSAATPQPTQSSKQANMTSVATQTQAFTGLDSCKLLTKEEIQAVQGEPFVDSKGSGKTGAGLSISQCYFQLPQAVNSIVITVTQKGEGAGARDPLKNWEEIFHREEKGGEKEEERREEGEHEPEKVDGIGDEAFWTGTRVGGALYVLKGNTYIRISVGGAGDQADKIRKSKALAQNILGRL